MAWEVNMRRQHLLIMVLLAIFVLSGTALADRREGERGRGNTGERLRKDRISGVIESVHGDRAVVRTSHGRRVDVNLGPREFWQSRRYHLEPGERVTVRGWHRDRDDYGPFFAGGIWGPGFYFELANGDGYPEWCDPDEYQSGWYPTQEYYDRCYYGPPTYGVAPTWWGYGPDYWHHRHPRRGTEVHIGVEVHGH
jgi:hypothetical protein